MVGVDEPSAPIIVKRIFYREKLRAT